MAYILHLVKNYNSFKYFQKQNATKYDVSQNRHMIFMPMAIVFDPSVQVQGLILLPFQRKMSGITFNAFSIFYFLICIMYNCSNCSRQALFYQKILTHDLRNQQRDLIIVTFCYIEITSDKNTYHYNSKVLCRVTRVSNSLDKFV